MIQSVRYQVFVSSTFTDLREERAEVLQAIWELDCIPTGMEAFLATNEAQWEVIQKVIDECDYYILLIGGRYGSVTDDGISYTEKEYNYAKSLAIPVLCFVHGDPENIPASKVEREESSKVRLETFRERVMSEHPVRKWTNAQELGGVVSRSISRAIKVNPRPGWIRSSGSSSFEMLEQINALIKENSALSKENTELKSRSDNSFGFGDDELASGLDTINLRGLVSIHNEGQSLYQAERKEWNASASWDDIFRDVGPILMNESTEADIESNLARFVGWDDVLERKGKIFRNPSISPETFAEVMVQFRALGFISKGTRKRAVSDRGSY